MRLVIFLLMFISGNFVYANEAPTILTCKTVEKIGRTDYTAQDKELFKGEKNLGKFHTMNEYLRDFVVTDLDSDTPTLKTIYYEEKNNKPLPYEEPVKVIKRTDEEIVLTYAKGVETGMITLWVKENKAMFFYTQTSSDLSAYAAAYDCK